MAAPHAVPQTLFAVVFGAAVEGFAAGVVCGLLVLLYQPWLQQLLTSQQDFGVALALYLFICAQVGVALSLVLVLVPRGRG